MKTENLCIIQRLVNRSDRCCVKRPLANQKYIVHLNLGSMHPNLTWGNSRSEKRVKLLNISVTVEPSVMPKRNMGWIRKSVSKKKNDATCHEGRSSQLLLHPRHHASWKTKTRRRLFRGTLEVEPLIDYGDNKTNETWRPPEDTYLMTLGRKR